MLPLRVIPFPDASTALIEWQLFELASLRRTLAELAAKIEGPDPRDAILAFTQFDALMGEVRCKQREYARSVAMLAAEDGMDAPSDFDDVARWVAPFEPASRIVCHAAMARVYLMTSAANLMEQAFGEHPAERAARVMSALEELSHNLIPAQRQCQQAAVGAASKGCWVVPNVFGRGEGPVYELRALLP